MMKIASATAVAAIVFAAPAFSQTATQPMTPSKVDYVQQQMEGQWLASNVMGETVLGTDKKSIGEVNNLLVDKDGKVTAAVIGVGGFLGIGEKDVAVPYTSLQLSNEADGDITLAATEEELRNAPEFKDLDDVNDARTNAAAQTGMPANPAAPAGGSMSTAPAAAPAPAPAPAQ